MMMKSMKSQLGRGGGGGGVPRQRFRGDSTTTTTSSSSSTMICLEEVEGDDDDEEKNYNDSMMYSSKRKKKQGRRKKKKKISITLQRPIRRMMVVVRHCYYDAGYKLVSNMISKIKQNKKRIKRLVILVLRIVLIVISLFLFYFIIIPMIRFTIQATTVIIERKFILPNACHVAIQSKLYLSQEQQEQEQQELSSGSRSSSSRGNLPKIIHQVWKDENIPTGRFADVHAAWKRLYPEPEYQHMLWTDETGRNLVETEFSWFLPTYDTYPMNIQRADVMRYFILYKYGGVYADLDYEPLINFWDYLSQDTVSLIESPYILNERVQNSLMASPQGHAFWNASFQILQQHAKDDSLLASTGPAAMDATIDVYNPNNSPDIGPYILPCQNFQRIPIFGVEFKERIWIAQLDQIRRFYSGEVKSCGDWTRRTNDCQFGIHHNSVSYDADLIRHNKEVEKKKQSDQFIVSNDGLHFLAITKEDKNHIVSFGLWDMKNNKNKNNDGYHEFLNGGSFLDFTVIHNNGRREMIHHRLGTSITQIGTTAKGILVTKEIIEENCGGIISAKTTTTSSSSSCETVVEIKSEWSMDDETGVTTSKMYVSVLGENSSSSTTTDRQKVQLSQLIFGLDQISNSQCHHHQLQQQVKEEKAKEILITAPTVVDISTTTTMSEEEDKEKDDPPVQLIWKGDPKRYASFQSVHNFDGCIHYATMTYDISSSSNDDGKQKSFSSRSSSSSGGITIQNTFHTV